MKELFKALKGAVILLVAILLWFALTYLFINFVVVKIIAGIVLILAGGYYVALVCGL